MADQYKYDYEKKKWIKVSSGTPSRGETNRNGRSSTTGTNKSGSTTKTGSSGAKTTTSGKTSTGSTSSSRTYSRGETNRSTTTSGTPKYNTYSQKTNSYSYSPKNSTTRYSSNSATPSYTNRSGYTSGVKSNSGSTESNVYDFFQKTWDGWVNYLQNIGSKKQTEEPKVDRSNETEDQRMSRAYSASASHADLDKISMEDIIAGKEQLERAMYTPGAQKDFDFVKFQTGKMAQHTGKYRDNVYAGVDALNLTDDDRKKWMADADLKADTAAQIDAMSRAYGGDMSALNGLTGKERGEVTRAGRLGAYNRAGEALQQLLPEEMQAMGTTPIDIPAGYDMHSLDEDRYTFLFKEKIGGGAATDQEWQEAKRRLELVLGIEDANDVKDWSDISFDPDYLKDMQTLNKGNETYQDVLEKTTQYNGGDIDDDFLVIRDYFEGHVPRSDDEVRRSANRIKAATGIDVLNAENLEAAFDQAVQTNEELRDAVAQAVYDETGKLPNGLDFNLDEYVMYMNAHARQKNRADREWAEQAQFDDTIQQKYGEYMNAPTFEADSQPISLDRPPANEAEMLHEIIVGIDDPDVFDQLVAKNLDSSWGDDGYFGLSAEMEKYNASTITPEQRKMFNYLWNSGMQDEAVQYIKDIDWSVRKAIAGKTEEVSEQLSEGPVGGAAASLATILSGPARAAVVPFNTARMAGGEEIDQYDQTFNVGRANDKIRGNVGQNLDELLGGANIAGWNIGSGVYQGLMSVADNWMLYGLGANLGGAVMGGEAADTAMRTALENGRGDLNALRDAYAQWGIEGVTEKMGMDKLFGEVGNPLKYVVTNALAEAGEEVSSEVMSIIYDTAMYGNDSDLGRLRDELITKGFLKGDLNWQLIKQVAGQLRDSMFGGLIGGAGGATPGAITTSVGDRSSGKNLQKNDAARSVLDFAQKMLPEGDIKALAQQQLDALDGKSRPVYNDKLNENNKFDVAKEETPKVSNAAIGRVFRELLANVDEHTRQILDGTMLRNVRDQLREMGVDDRRIAEAVNRIVAGDGSATPEDYVAVATNDAAHAVTKSLTDQVSYVSDLNKQVGEFAEKAAKPPKTKNTEQPTKETTEEAPAAETAEDAFADEEFSDEEFAGEPMSESSVTSDGEEVSVVGAESVDADGELVFKVQTADGTEKTVKASGVTLGLNDSDAIVLARAAQEYGASAASMFNARTPGQDAEEYAAAFKKAVQYGADGMNKDTIASYDSVKTLNPNQLGIAYEIGRAERNMRSELSHKSMVEKMTANGPVKVGNVDISGVNVSGLNQHQRRSVVVLRNIAELLGINIKLMESVANEQGAYTTENGSWNPNTLTLSLDVHAGSNIASDTNYALMHTASHELTHAIFQFADTKVRDDYIDFVLGSLGQKMGDSAIEAKIEEYLGKAGVKNRDDAIEEIVAEASVEALSKMTEEDIQNLADENPRLARRIARKIYDWVSKMKAKIAKAFAGTEAKNDYAKMMNDQLDELAKKWNAALLNAVQNKNQIQRDARLEEAKRNDDGWIDDMTDADDVADNDEHVYNPFPAARAERRAAVREKRANASGERVYNPEAISNDAFDAEAYEFPADSTTKKQSDQNGLPLANNHIDQRTPQSVRESDTTLFCSEVEEAQVGFAAAANMLLYDAENSVHGQKFFTGDGEVTGQARMTSPLLGKIKDSTGWTWDKIINSLRQFAAMETGDTMPKNTVTNREMELYLDEVLSKGYTTLDGQKVSPWSEYIEAKNGYQGSDGTTAPQSAYDGAIDFAEYAFAGEFADDGVKYHARSAKDDDTSSIKEQIAASKHVLDSMDPVYTKTIRLPKGDKKKVIKWAIDELASTGYQVDRQGFGRITFDKDRIDNSFNYLNTPGEFAAMLAVPRVLKRGVEVAGHRTHKYRGFPTVTFAAAVEINGVRGNMAVVVKQEGRNTYKTHRIVMPDGSAFEYKEKAEPTPARGVASNGSYALPISSASANSIAESDDGVKFSMRNPQTETPEFQKWFKGSKIVNEDGSPKVMYHGTPYGGFTVFKDWQYFTDNREYADVYQEPSASSIRGRYDPATNPATYEVYLKVKKPFDTRIPSVRRIWETEYYRKWGTGTPLMESGLPDWTDGMDLVEFIEENEYGYDAIILDEGATGGYGDEVKSRGISVVVRSSKQVKSATDNVGTFDPKNPDIRHQLRDPDQVSDRELLANAMDDVAQNEAELDFVRRYRKQIEQLDQKQRELEQVGQEIIQARKDGARKSDIAVLQEKSKILRKQLDRMDGKLLEFEAGKPLQAVVKRQRAELQEKARERMNKRVEEVRRKEAEYRDQLRERVTQLRNEKNARIEQLKREKTEAVKKVRDEKNESFARQKYRDRLEEDIKTLRTWVTSPTNKEHVPQFMRKPLGDMIAALDFSSVRSLDGGADTQKDQKLKDALDAMNLALVKLHGEQEGLDKGAASFATIIDLPFGYNEEFTELVAKIKSTMDATTASNDTAINRMTSTQLKDLSRAIRTLTTSIRQMNRLLANAKYESAVTAANDTMTSLDDMAEKKDSFKLTEGIGKFMDWTNTVPYYAFKRFGEGGKAIFSGLMDGWDKLAFNSDKLVKFAEEAYTAKDVKKWSGEMHKVDLTSGASVRMTTAQLMSLYCLGKRAQAVGHLLGGGIRIADIDSKGKKITQSENYTLTQADLDNFGSMLTDRQREVADKLQEFMSTQGAEWGNEVSMKRFGYEMFTEAHYFPIETDSNNRRTIDEQAQENSLFRLLNMSATKALTKGANNAIVVRDIFDVFTAHSSDMAKYNALGLQILDAMKWLNYVERTQNDDGSISTRSVQKSLERAYGKDARAYILQLLRDLNGVKEGGTEGGFFNKAISNAKVASVAGNIRVYLLQATSMPRAAYAINPAYLSIGLAKMVANPVKAAKTAISKVGIAKWKSMGFYDTNISGNIREMVKHDQSVADKFREASMAPAGWFDNMTMATIYYAVEAECAKKYPNTKKGSATWDKLVNDRVREIVYQTQVVDSTMTRSSAMRSQNALLKLSTSFMSEPTLTLNMLMDGVYEARMKARGAKIKAPTAKIVRSMGVFTVAAVLTAAMEALFDAERDDDEFETFAEKYMAAFIGDISGGDSRWDKFTKVLFSNLGSNFNILNNIPVASELMSTLEGYESTNLYSAFVGSFQSAFNAYKRYLAGEGTAYGWIYSGLKGVSQLSGLPVSNIAREGVSIWNTFFAEQNDKIRIQTYPNNENDAAVAIAQARRAGDKERVTHIRERAALYGMDNEKINQILSGGTKKSYTAGEIDRATAAALLAEDGDMRDREIESALLKGDYQLKTGLVHANMKADFISGVLSESDARKYLKEYDGLRDREIDERIKQWQYEKSTGLSYGNMKQDYIDGELTDSEVKSYRMKYGGADEADVEDLLGQWQYEKDTGLLWSELKLDYADGVISESKLRDYLKVYGGKDEEEIEEKISNYDFQIATGRTTTAPKYWRIAHAAETGGDYGAYIDEAFQKIMYGGEKKKTQKQARSQIASSLASYYKYYYLPIAGTAEGNAMLERILDVYEAIGYSRSYEREYIAENWFED